MSVGKPKIWFFWGKNISVGKSVERPAGPGSCFPIGYFLNQPGPKAYFSGFIKARLDVLFCLKKLSQYLNKIHVGWMQKLERKQYSQNITTSSYWITNIMDLKQICKLKFLQWFYFNNLQMCWKKAFFSCILLILSWELLDVNNHKFNTSQNCQQNTWTVTISIISLARQKAWSRF